MFHPPLLFHANDLDFVSDLKNSPAVEELNEQFRHLAPMLSNWSFYKTLAISTGEKKITAQGKESSFLGYHEEISGPSQADHHVRKFTSSMDTSNVIVRNAITLAARFRDVKSGTPAKSPNPMTSLDESLNIQDLFRNCSSTGANYNAIRFDWVPNTYEWLLEEKGFISSLQPTSLKPAVL
ncbi:hypothetical protein ANO14919_057680 [Xylariales sp. No.14919]|nr:hypothetical protein ANO14919_057680 [Xylariales sp. No.14919]